MSNPPTTVLFHLPSGGWDEASKCQTKAPLCPPKVLASAGIIITHLAHGALPLLFSLNHDIPLWKRSSVNFPTSHQELLPAWWESQINLWSSNWEASVLLTDLYCFDIVSLTLKLSFLLVSCWSEELHCLFNRHCNSRECDPPKEVFLKEKPVELRTRWDARMVQVHSPQQSVFCFQQLSISRPLCYLHAASSLRSFCLQGKKACFSLEKIEKIVDLPAWNTETCRVVSFLHFLL